MCHEALVTCLNRLRAAIVAYAELSGTIEPGPEREQVLDFAQTLAKQARVIERLCHERCGAARCISTGVNT